MGKSKTSAFDEVFTVVRRIPRGRVMTYGQISNMLNRRLSPVAVGWALHQCSDGLPWHRVVNAKGTCSTDQLAHHPHGLQQALLEAEGVAFDAKAALDLDKYRWRPDD